MPYHDLPAFMVKLLTAQQVKTDPWDASPFLIEFLVLTATRLGQCMKMRWREVNFKECMWNSPGAHTKSGEPHNIPLSDGAIALLQAVRRAMPPTSDSDLVFPGVGGRNVMQGRNTSMRYMQRLGVRGPTLHGFRSSFKTWSTKVVGDDGKPLYPRDLSELALHHTIGDAVELAYLRAPDGRTQEDTERGIHAAAESTKDGGKPDHVTGMLGASLTAV
jgi:integrase